ncbi:hypothetical protein [Glycomyces harbinensis]|uniref:Uncharacterized protein n=1 Tax=Glycomyces harbinensis TaxID=58114 RepID=A0A1G7DZW8_9ACTN|nr:hypothetical protein [Glycomyces harbinensis]SDE56800.1 hypothetical protein SAMN05216270_1325 [Glycomyces harbinensis]
MDTHASRVGRFAGQTGPLVGAFMIAVLAACGSGEGGSDESATPSTVTAPTEATTPPEATEEDPVTEETTPYLDPSLGDSSKPGSDSQTTISGTVASGVETGCLVLEHNGTLYGIYGSFDSSVVYAGATVTLHGKVEADMMTTCQQGTPFVVEDAESAD